RGSRVPVTTVLQGEIGDLRDQLVLVGDREVVPGDLRDELSDRDALAADGRLRVRPAERIGKVMHVVEWVSDMSTGQQVFNEICHLLVMCPDQIENLF